MRSHLPLWSATNRPQASTSVLFWKEGRFVDVSPPGVLRLYSTSVSGDDAGRRFVDDLWTAACEPAGTNPRRCRWQTALRPISARATAGWRTFYPRSTWASSRARATRLMSGWLNAPGFWHRSLPATY